MLVHNFGSSLDPQAFISEVQRVHRSLAAEHEFAAIASWLGKCSLLTALDDVLHPAQVYRVPDFLVVANYEGREVPFLVEVKSDSEDARKKKDALKWSDTYLSSLRAFADLLRLPLLIAWKHYGLWVLVDSNLFTKKETSYHLTFDDAAKNSLMSLLFGNAWIMLDAGFRFELKMKIRDAIDFTAEVLPEGAFKMVITDAGLWAGNHRLNSKEDNELFWFFLAGESDTEFLRDGHIATHQFLVDPERTFNLSDVLVSRLMWKKREEGRIDWLGEIRIGLPQFRTDMEQLLKHAIDAGAVRYVLKQQPHMLPAFLEKPEVA